MPCVRSRRLGPRAEACGNVVQPSINVHNVSIGALESFFSSACQKLLTRACSCTRTSAGSCSSRPVGTGPDNSNTSTQWFHQGAPGWLSCLVQWAVREQLAAGAPLTSGCILPAAGTASARSAATPPSVGRIVAARTWPQEAQLPSPDFRQVLRADVAPPHAVGTSAICGCTLSDPKLQHVSRQLHTNVTALLWCAASGGAPRACWQGC